ncbi:hypothetical protein ACSBR1_037686 [Camellia fascicularis]
MIRTTQCLLQVMFPTVLTLLKLGKNGLDLLRVFPLNYQRWQKILDHSLRILILRWWRLLIG